ncbi:MAG: response regulator, partial [Haliea sp.]
SSSEARRALSAQATLGPLPLLLYRDAGEDGGGRFAWNSDDRVTVHEVHTPARLFDLALLAMHLNLARLPEAKRGMLDDIAAASKPLAGKRVLIVDDDMRNIFALATVLEEHAMDIVWADNGREAINRVASDPQIKVVLMDIMMPEMDGMATMKEIRKLPAGKSLPMIAVTAKAMKGDREKCIEAGAWDYLSKPVNTQDLLSVLRAWLHQ